MRDAAPPHHPRVGVETGGSNIQFAVHPETGRMVVIEMNPRVSRSSALASKATGFPIAKIAAKLALGYHLDEIPNDITRLTPASFEPTIDYVVVKIPRWNFEKFPQADRTLTTQMKSVGEVMAIGRTFKEAFMKGVRSLELGRSSLLFAPADADRGVAGPRAEDDTALRKQLAIPHDRRMWDIFRAIARGWTVERIHELTKIDRGSAQFAEIAACGAARRAPQGSNRVADAQLKRAGSAIRIGAGDPAAKARSARRDARAETPVYKRVERARPNSNPSTPYCTARYEPTCESESDAAQQSRHSGEWSESHRAGHRIRLLLLSCGLRVARRGPRDSDDQLQPGNSLD
jgi:carbamoyl-phosphate synthase large subunit